MNDTTPTPDAPEPLPQEHVDHLVDTFMAGFASGISTYLLQGHSCTDEACPVQALAYAAARGLATHALEDPAFRLDLGTGLERKWHDPNWHPGVQVMHSHGRTT